MSPGRWSARRVVPVATLAACSLALIAGGAFAAFARSSTYLDLGAHGIYSTGRYALTSESTNWRTTLLGWAGSVRLKVASEDGKPIFAGVAAPAAIGRYLSGAGYTTIGEHGARADHAGAAPAAPSATAVDWTAQATGTGTQTLRWKATEGRQVAFAMNADRSRPLRVRVESSAVTLGRMPWWVPAGLALAGIAMLAAAAMLVRLGRGVNSRARTP
jgi:hypothetical protein